MMKYVSCIALSLGLAACGSVPQNATDLRTHPITKGKSIQVSRSANAAFATISKRAASCMNFGVRTQITRIGGTAGQGSNAILSNSYRTSTQSSGAVRSLIVENYNPATIGTNGWYPYMLVDVAPSSGGSTITSYAGPGNAVFVRAIEAWARGDTRPCPKNNI